MATFKGSCLCGASARPAALEDGFTLERFDEWWHARDKGKPPRLISFLFRKPGRSGA